MVSTATHPISDLRKAEAQLRAAREESERIDRLEKEAQAQIEQASQAATEAAERAQQQAILVQQLEQQVAQAERDLTAQQKRDLKQLEADKKALKKRSELLNSTLESYLKMVDEVSAEVDAMAETARHLGVTGPSKMTGWNAGWDDSKRRLVVVDTTQNLIRMTKRGIA